MNTANKDCLEEDECSSQIDLECQLESTDICPLCDMKEYYEKWDCEDDQRTYELNQGVHPDFVPFAPCDYDENSFYWGLKKVKPKTIKKISDY